MKFFNILNNFRNDEDGAVTVDWVVLTAAIVGLGIAVLTTVGGGINELSLLGPGAGGIYRRLRSNLASGPSKNRRTKMIHSLIALFRKNEDGAVTVDWVVLTSGIILIVLAALVPFANGIYSVSELVADEVSSSSVEKIHATMD